MDFKKYTIKRILLILIICILVVILFPATFANENIYLGVLITAIGVVLSMLFFLFKVHLFDSGKQDHLPE